MSYSNLLCNPYILCNYITHRTQNPIPGYIDFAQSIISLTLMAFRENVFVCQCLSRCLANIFNHGEKNSSKRHQNNYKTTATSWNKVMFMEFFMKLLYSNEHKHGRVRLSHLNIGTTCLVTYCIAIPSLKRSSYIDLC